MVNMEINISRSTRITIVTFLCTLIFLVVSLFMKFEDSCIYIDGQNTPDQGCVKGAELKVYYLLLILSIYIMYVSIESILWLLKDDKVVIVKIGIENKKPVFNIQVKK